MNLFVYFQSLFLHSFLLNLNLSNEQGYNIWGPLLLRTTVRSVQDLIPRTFDKRLKEAKELFEKWKQYTESSAQKVPMDQLRKDTRG